ncbi:DUF805 domain-containing protein [Phaeobacter sp. HF9A]|nr:DUF805 domain-containing protein [Phaeobacter sp. HF9A]
MVCALPMISVGWRRMHDVGKPGYFPYLTIFAWILIVAGVLIAYNGFGATIEDIRDTGQAKVQINPALGLAILVAFILVLITNIRWLVSPSLSGANKYGPNPNEVPL